MSAPNDRDRAAEYVICKRRGHQPSEIVLSSIPPKRVCKWCGTAYWFTEPELCESNAPPAEGDDDA